MKTSSDNNHMYCIMRIDCTVTRREGRIGTVYNTAMSI